MVYRDMSDAMYGSRYKYGALVLVMLVFVLLAWLLIAVAPIDPLLPVIVIVAIILLIPVAVFFLEIFFYGE